MQEDIASLKRKLALSYQILYMEGVAREDTLGHLSARLPGSEHACIKPWGMGFDEVTPNNLLAMDQEGRKVCEVEGRLHSEVPIHNEIYKVRPDVNCVIHIHPFYTTLLSSIWIGRILQVNQNTQAFFDGIAYYESSDLIRAKEQGNALARTLGDLYTVLLRNHGVAIAAPTVEQALLLAIQLEKAAQAHITMTPFSDITEIPEQSARRWSKELFKMAHSTNKFEYWCRKLKREGRGVYLGEEAV